MGAFATVEDMRQRTNGLITATSHEFLQKELDAASREIRDYCGWHIATIEELTYSHRSRFHDDVWLPAMRIQSIESATVDGVAWADLSGVEFDAGTGWVNLRGRHVEVIYRAGFETVPESIVSLTLQIAARALGGAMGIIREQTLGASLTFSGAGDDRSRFESVLAPYRIGYVP